MGIDIGDVVQRLDEAGVRLDRALTDADLKKTEKRYGFSFGPDHRALLRAALPSGDAWLNWRHATPAQVRVRLDVPPVDGVPLVPLYGNHYLPAVPAASGSPVYVVARDGVTVHSADLLAYVEAEFGD